MRCLALSAVVSVRLRSRRVPPPISSHNRPSRPGAVARPSQCDTSIMCWGPQEKEQEKLRSRRLKFPPPLEPLSVFRLAPIHSERQGRQAAERNLERVKRRREIRSVRVASRPKKKRKRECVRERRAEQSLRFAERFELPRYCRHKYVRDRIVAVSTITSRRERARERDSRGD